MYLCIWFIVCWYLLHPKHLLALYWPVHVSVASVPTGTSQATVASVPTGTLQTEPVLIPTRNIPTICHAPRRLILTQKVPSRVCGNYLGSHKPVCGGKRRAESTVSIHSNNNPVTVIDYPNPNPNHNPNLTNANGVDCSSLTTANRFMRAQIVSHRRGRVPFTSVSDV